MRRFFSLPLWMGVLLLTSAACGNSPSTPVTGGTPTAPTTSPAAQEAPGVQIGYISRFPRSIELLGNVVDHSGGPGCGSEYCLGATATGSCGPISAFTCTCLEGLVLDVVKSAASGTCTVSFVLKDAKGMVGTPSVSFEVAGSGTTKW